jgi:threonine efflux protein
MFIALCTLAFIHFCALVTPGPDFLLVSQTAISRSRKDGIFVVLGITAGVMLWALLALMGLNFLFEQFHWLKRALLIAGGLYLCWLGYLMLRSALREKSATTETKVVDLPTSAGLSFLKGLLTNLSNPKAVIYFGSVFSLFLANPVLAQWHSLLFVIVSVETLLWFSLVAFVFSLARFKAAYENASQWIDGISGGLFTALGVYLIGNR